MTLDDLADGVLGGSFWGLGVAAAAGAVLLIGKGSRPLLKQALRGYLLLTERVRELTEQASEQLEDIYAEVEAELEGAEGVASDLTNARPAPTPELGPA